MAQMNYRIGVDVGGTFTHAVAVDSGSGRLAGKVKVPTTHTAAEGVARGVAQAIGELLETTGFSPASVTFIAHSTTQATNALLEGDVAPVGIVATGKGLEGWRVKHQSRIGDIPLGGDHSLKTLHQFIHRNAIEQQAAGAIQRLKAAGAGAMVAADAFSVDDPSREKTLTQEARKQGLPATGTHEISGLYGLRVRTRTAALNASIMPPMIEAASMTETSVKSAGISAPLMVMRSDGGVMKMEEVRKRPLLTILSGPAAGVAAALMFVRLSDGVFLEVGGTSTDISLISMGRAHTQSAQVGGHRLFLRTLDVRTIGLGGGSMIRLGGGKPLEVGPRSAHIANLPYCCYGSTEALREAGLRLVAPREGDPADYIVLEAPDGRKSALTLTCAANALGKLADDDYASGNRQSARAGFGLLADFCGRPGEGEALAQAVLALAARKAAATVEKLLLEYGAGAESTRLIGGGGAGGVLVPATAEALGTSYRICPEAEVISAIGVALALVRETIERNIIDPGPDDLVRIRREAQEGAVRAGAAPESISVEIEVEPLQNLVRASASGATELRTRDLARRQLSESECRQVAADSLGVKPEEVHLVGRAAGMCAYSEDRSAKRLQTAGREKVPLRLVDAEGIVRLQLPAGEAVVCSSAEADEVLKDLLERHTEYGDAGARLPRIFLVVAGRIINLSNLASAEQASALAGSELELHATDEQIMWIVG